MPPEQSAGDWDIVDERADVFSLGAILCEILTGHPPYHGANREDLLRRARRGDIAEALGLLTKCDADAVLVDLCRECLASERLQRPRHAGVVAERLASYQAEVSERLRQAELQRARAEVKALEERKRRRLLAALALMALVLLAGSGGGLWWRQLKQDRADQAALAALDQGHQRLKDGWRLHDLAMLREAKAEAERAADITRGGISDAVERQVADFLTAAAERLERAEKNRELLNALVDIATPHETKTYKTDQSDKKILAVPEPSVEEQYAAAFRRRWPDVEIEKQAVSAVAERLQEEPEVVLQGVIAGVDGWMLEQRRQKRAEEKWRHLFELVERLDHSEPRRQLRALLIGAVPPRAEDVAELLGERPPWIALWKLGQGKDWRHLRRLREQMDVTAEPVLTVVLLSQVSRELGDKAGAEEVLRLALARRPDKVALLDALGKVLLWQGRSRLAEAIGCYRAARARQPSLGIALGRTLVGAGRAWRSGPSFLLPSQTLEQARQAAAEGEAILRDLVRQQPQNPEMRIALGDALAGQGKLGEAETVYRKGIEFQPDNAYPYMGLVRILSQQAKHAEEEAVYRKFILLRPEDPWGYKGLAWNLTQQGNSVEAEAAYRKAIALKPEDVWVYFDLARVLSSVGKHAEEEAAYRKAIALKPDDDLAYSSLGNALRDQRKYAEAEAAYRKAIAIKPAKAWVYTNLDSVLKLQGKPTEEEAALRKAITLKPDNAEAYRNLGRFLDFRGKHPEAEAVYRKLITLKPEDAYANENLGFTLLQQGKYAEAEAAYRKCIVLRPDNVLIYINLGSALRSQGKDAEAEAVYRKAITLRLDESILYRTLGMLLSAQGKHEEAEAAYRKAIAVRPKDILTYVVLGDALRDRKKYAEAEVVYRTLIALQPNVVWGYTNLDSVLRLQGKPLEAEAAFRKMEFPTNSERGVKGYAACSYSTGDR